MEGITFMICLALWSGGVDCSYEANIVELPLLNHLYAERTQTVEYRYEDPSQAGFTSFGPKQIFLTNNASWDTVIHEIKHAKCHLEYEKSGKDHPRCKGHFSIEQFL
jgi:hypothetical protein